MINHCPSPLSEFAFGRHGELTRIAGVHCPPALGLGLANIHLWRLLERDKVDQYLCLLLLQWFNEIVQYFINNKLISVHFTFLQKYQN